MGEAKRGGRREDNIEKYKAQEKKSVMSIKQNEAKSRKSYCSCNLQISMT